MKIAYDIAAIGEAVIDMVPYAQGPSGNPAYEACPGGAPVNCLAAAAARRVAHLHGCQQLLCELQDRRDHTRMKFFLQHF